jgi:uncharacterized protein (TIGR02001 family)
MQCSRSTSRKRIAAPNRAGVARRLLRLSPAAYAFGLVAPAAAVGQLAGTVAIDSDYRLRGDSLTGERPAVSAEVSYDDPSGFYLGSSAVVELGHGGRFLGVIADGGYAKRLNDHVSLDVGVLRTQLRSAARYAPAYEYTEVYAGAYIGAVAARVYYSPDYRNSALSTLYGELEAGFEPAPNWRVSGHGGVLTYLGSNYPYGNGDTLLDWRVSVSRQLGRFEIHSALSGNGPGRHSGDGGDYGTALTVGAAFNF